MKKAVNKLAALTMAGIMMRAAYESKYGIPSPDTRKCRECKHCPKSFCKLAKHAANKTTPVNYCNHFELCE